MSQREKNEKFIFVAFAVVVGFIVHGSYIFDKQIWHDDACSLMGITPVYSLGQGHWMRAIINTIVDKIIGNEQIIILHAIIVFICIGLIAVTLFQKLNIINNFSRIVIIIYMVSNIAVLSNMGYADCLAVNFITLYILTVAIILMFEGIMHINILKIMIGMLTLICSLAVYQCYFAYYISLLLVLYFDYILSNDSEQISYYWKKGILMIFISIVCLGIYIVSVELSVRLVGIKLSSYAATDTYGVVSFFEYVTRVKYAYYQFFIQEANHPYSFFPIKWIGWWKMLLIIFVVSFVIIGRRFFIKKEYSKIITMVFLLVCFPLAQNLIFVMYGQEVSHGLHTFHSIYTIVLLVIISEYASKICSKYLTYSVLCLILVLNGLLIKYDNICYTSIKAANEKSINYVTVLISDIHNVEGYEEGMHIYMVNTSKFIEKGLDNSVFSNEIVTDPYNASTLYYTANEFIKYHIYDNFFVRDLEISEYEKYDIENMPIYPSANSIKVVDNKVIVKF